MEHAFKINDLRYRSVIRRSDCNVYGVNIEKRCAMSDGIITTYTPRDVYVAATCYGKQSFENGAQAHRRLREMSSKAKRKHRHKNKGGRVVYRCTVCHKWHIGGAS